MGNFENKEFLVWTQDFSVEIEELDNHHKEMIKLINTLRDAMSSNVGSEKTNELIVDLFNYANYHFGAEEALFLLKDYPFIVTLYRKSLTKQLFQACVRTFRRGYVHL